MIDWTPENVEKLKRLIDEGKRAKEVGKLLGGTATAVRSKARMIHYPFAGWRYPKLKER